MESVDVVEAAIVRLRHHRQRTAGWQRIVLHLPCNDRVAHHAHAVRVGNADGSLEKSAFLYPRGSRHLAVAVEREPCAEHRIGIAFAAWMNHRDTGAHGTASGGELPRTADQCGVPNLHTGHVGDGAKRAGSPADRDAEFTSAGLGLCGHARDAKGECSGEAYQHSGSSHAGPARARGVFSA